MITGHELTDLHARIMDAAMRAILRSAGDGGATNRAARESITNRGVYTYVYNGYTPTVYIRRYGSGGLADNDNLMTTTIATGPRAVTIDVEDRTPAGDGGMINPPPDPVFYLSDIIEDGANGPKWRDPDWPGARPYLDRSMQDECTNGAIDGAAADAVTNMPDVR